MELTLEYQLTFQWVCCVQGL